MNTLDCLITGCAFIDAAEEKWAWGDLHRIGSAYIFNSVLDEHGQTRWTWGTPPARKAVTVHGHAYYEKRGVIVFDLSAGGFNNEAIEHFRKELK